MQRIKTEREKEERHEAIWLPKESSLKCNIWLQLLTATTSKKLQTTQTQLQEISYAPEHNQETSYAQTHKQETSIQT